MTKKLRLVKTKFTLLSKQLNKEHQVILDTLDKLYKVCETHWTTENNLFNKGLKNLPSGHKTIKSQIRSHKHQHINLLNEIAIMKKNIINHIDTEDANHFHWLKNI